MDHSKRNLIVAVISGVIIAGCTGSDGSSPSPLTMPESANPIVDDIGPIERFETDEYAIDAPTDPQIVEIRGLDGPEAAVSVIDRRDTFASGHLDADQAVDLELASAFDTAVTLANVFSGEILGELFTAEPSTGVSEIECCGTTLGFSDRDGDATISGNLPSDNSSGSEDIISVRVLEIDDGYIYAVVFDAEGTNPAEVADFINSLESTQS